MSALIEFDEVCKYYQMGDTTVKAADHITMKTRKMASSWPSWAQSGSGKSTCMNIIGCLDVPTHGTYRLNGKGRCRMSRNELASVRNEMLGFIFQQYNLFAKAQPDGERGGAAGVCGHRPRRAPRPGQRGAGAGGSGR